MPPRHTWAGPEVAADHLRVLLARPGRYRDRWVRRAERPRDGEISQAAVARVIADYLRAEGGVESDDQQEYRRLKDRVNRALSGKALTVDTLTWFTHAFILSEDDARQLWSHFTGAAPDQVNTVVRKLSPPPADAAAFRPLGFRTVSLHETHVLNADGRVDRHETRQGIEATTDGLIRYPVRLYDMEAVAITVSNGTASDRYRCDDGVVAVDIILPRPLRRGETTEVSYTLTYHADEPSAQRWQRGAIRPLLDVSISVRFSPRRRPTSVWWATWREFGADTKPLLCEPVKLDRHHTVSKQLSSAESTIVGFYWEW